MFFDVLSLGGVMVVGVCIWQEVSLETNNPFRWPMMTIDALSIIFTSKLGVISAKDESSNLC